MQPTVIYTDGSCVPNPGPGGWAAIIISDKPTITLQGYEEQTTNNRMELLAIIKALESVPKNDQVKIFSDSKYAINTITHGWKRNTNHDLWERLDNETAKRGIEWEWVKGHSGDPMNEQVDMLAREAADMIINNQETISLSHVDHSGKATMVDISSKHPTAREAVAKGSVLTNVKTINLIRENGFEKGDVLGIARVAGIMGGKSAQSLIPLCHPLSLTQLTVDLGTDIETKSVNITAKAKTTGKTGVEMEALTAVSIAALTIYDMCKSVDKTMRISNVRLVSKSGGSSGDLVFE